MQYFEPKIAKENLKPVQPALPNLRKLIFYQEKISGGENKKSTGQIHVQVGKEAPGQKREIGTEGYFPEQGII
jgi:hypothetical protein